MRLSDIPDIQCAFAILFQEKLLQDGYIDVSDIGLATVNKESAIAALKKIKSPYIGLYNAVKQKIPEQYDDTEQWALDIWENVISFAAAPNRNITLLEARYLIAWVDRVLGGHFLTFCPSIMKVFLEIIRNSEYFIDEELDHTHVAVYEGSTVIYFTNVVTPVVVSHLSEYLEFLNDNIQTTNRVFYRGHSLLNYQMLPSIMRRNTASGKYDLLRHEDQFYNELLCKIPEEFQGCRTHFERLTIMQHFELPTRLLDITANPLVALYFACCSNESKLGEVVVIATPTEKVLWPTSPEISVMAALSGLSYKDKIETVKIAEECMISGWDQIEDGELPSCEFVEEFLMTAPIKRLIYEMKQDGAEADDYTVTPNNIISYEIVNPIYNNQRLIRQNGLFILYGYMPIVDHDDTREGCLEESDNEVIITDEYRLCMKDAKDQNCSKKLLLMVDNKQEILRELENVCIDEVHLFPDIEHAARSMLRHI